MTAFVESYRLAGSELSRPIANYGIIPLSKLNQETLKAAHAISLCQSEHNGVYLWDQAKLENERTWHLTQDELQNAFGFGGVIGWLS